MQEADLSSTVKPGVVGLPAPAPSRTSQANEPHLIHWKCKPLTKLQINHFTELENKN